MNHSDSTAKVIVNIKTALTFTREIEDSRCQCRRTRDIVKRRALRWANGLVPTEREDARYILHRLTIGAVGNLSFAPPEATQGEWLGALDVVRRVI